MAMRSVIISLCIVFSICFTFSGAVAGSAEVDSGTPRAEYWINKLSDPDKQIMTEEQIGKYNQEIQRKLPTTVFDLHTYPDALTPKTLLELLGEAALPEGEKFMNGVPVTASYYGQLRAAMNVNGVQERNPVEYGITVVRSNMRTFPTNLGIFETPEDREFDLFQETIVNPAEPVLILHRSLHGEWYYVQTDNYRGWVSAQDIAIAANRKDWLEYMDAAHYLVVTGSSLNVQDHPEVSVPLVFEMGAKIPLAEKMGQAQDGYVVKLPARGKQGQLYFKNVLISDKANVNVGYLRYTRANILRQALRFYGRPYGWGGMHNSVDCSSLTMDVYRSFGFKLPRNADQQEVNVGKVIKLKPGETTQTLQALRPGATLHMNGHVMLYLGREGDKYYVIHALAAYGDQQHKNRDGTLRRIETMRVVVSDLDLTRRKGKTFKDSVTVGKMIEW